MRIDPTSLIAAQSVPRPETSAQPSARASKPLFEPLDFTKTGQQTALQKTPSIPPQERLQRPGSKLDITV